jgi:DNA-binding GntR family transcriptional regulator
MKVLKKIEIPLPTSDLVADSIRRGIIYGDLKIGQKISVAEIAAILNVSATPVKQAFKMLQTEGLLLTKARSKTIISDFARQNLENIAIIRSALEGAAAYIAAQIISPGELENLEEILKEGDKAIERKDLEFLVIQNTRFHKSLREASCNNYLVNLIERLVSFDYSFRYSALQTLDERRLGRDEHWEIFANLKEHNSEGSEKALVTHIRRTAFKVVAHI